jgi:hypothetical protein
MGRRQYRKGNPRGNDGETWQQVVSRPSASASLGGCGKTAAAAAFPPHRAADALISADVLVSSPLTA